MPLLDERSGLEAGTDYALAYSPERINPGSSWTLRETPKVVAGITEADTDIAMSFYATLMDHVVRTSSPREAEMAKLIENIYRHVNIALINELAIYAYELNIDIWEAIEAAATKPFGYQPFWPSPGWGGHCIPLDPTYLSHTVRKHRAHDIHFVELAQSVNSEMPRHVTERASLMLNERRKPVRGSRILALGVAYKGGTEDTRHSPGVRVLELLASRGARVSYHDPLVQQVEIAKRSFRSVALTKRRLREADLVIALVRQEGIDWDLVGTSGGLVFDCCRALQISAKNIKRL
jgi:UDP-N-acetyl-D-glucosamine dehydrogenase